MIQPLTRWRVVVILVALLTPTTALAQGAPPPPPAAPGLTPLTAPATTPAFIPPPGALSPMPSKGLMIGGWVTSPTA